MKGVNQLSKEIVETQDIPNKIIDAQAIHRNEQTNEYEAQEEVQKYFNETIMGKPQNDAQQSRQRQRDAMSAINMELTSKTQKGGGTSEFSQIRRGDTGSKRESAAGLNKSAAFNKRVS